VLSHPDGRFYATIRLVEADNPFWQLGIRSPSTIDRLILTMQTFSNDKPWGLRKPAATFLFAGIIFCCTSIMPFNIFRMDHCAP
jgi:hypothetical protein